LRPGPPNALMRIQRRTVGSVFIAVDTGAKKELVTAMINKVRHRFSMAILLTVTARESKVSMVRKVS